MRVEWQATNAEILTSLIHGLNTGASILENATAHMDRCTMINNRLGVYLNGSVYLEIRNSTIGPNQFGGFDCGYGSVASVLNVSQTAVPGDFW